MYNSINYIEISCKYNKVDLQLFAGVFADGEASRVFVYRNRKYEIKYVKNEDEFRVFDSKGLLMAIIVGGVFKYYVTSAPEIGIDLIFGFLAKLNIYPVKAF